MVGAVLVCFLLLTRGILTENAGQNNLTRNVSDYFDPRSHLICRNFGEIDADKVPNNILLRVVQLGVHISEMDLLTIGEINDMYSEMQNDEVPEAYSQLPVQRDFDLF